MKELSIEGKATRYDEIVKKVNKMHHENCDACKACVEELIPELKESEDEKIRKELLNAFKESEDSIYMVFTPHRRESFIAWLEKQRYSEFELENEYWRGYDDAKKQGEQKPDTQNSTEWSISDFRTWKYIVSDVLTKKDGIGQYLDSGECKKIAKYMQEEWGGKLSKEQKQEELLKSEDYGIDGLYHAIGILEKTLGKVEGYQSDDGILEHKCAISAVKKLYKQNPAWSEEDEEIQYALISLVERQTNYPTKWYFWLKSLKDRVHPQPKQEWGEEDNKIIEEIINDIECARAINYHAPKEDYEFRENWLKYLKYRIQPQLKQEWGGEDEYNQAFIIEMLYGLEDKDKEYEKKCRKMAEWLKSLRPQSQWKPSLSQLNALGVVAKGNAPDDIEEINSLYNDLKKL